MEQKNTNLLKGTKKYTISPHILKNLQHTLEGGVKNVFSLDFLKDLILNRERITMLSWGTKTNETIVGALSMAFDTVYLEDGLYRSFETGKREPKTRALVADKESPYYNAREHKELDSMVERKKDILTPEIIEEGKRCLDFILTHRLTKYNNNLPLGGDIVKDARNILIVDQTAGDQSITKGWVEDGVDIVSMVMGIKKRRPDAAVFVKVHPETISGDKESCLEVKQNLEFLEANNVALIETNYNPIELIETMDEIHVLTSQMGFEALLLGKEVFTYGEPFYAKYRLTRHIRDNSQNQEVSTLELFTIFCLLYTRYFEVGGGEISFWKHLNNLAEEKRSLSTK